MKTLTNLILDSSLENVIPVEVPRWQYINGYVSDMLQDPFSYPIPATPPADYYHNRVISEAPPRVKSNHWHNVIQYQHYINILLYTNIHLSGPVWLFLQFVFVCFYASKEQFVNCLLLCFLIANTNGAGAYKYLLQLCLIMTTIINYVSNQMCKYWKSWFFLLCLL